MSSFYRVVLFIHVLGAAAWVGGALYNFLLGWRLRTTRDALRMAAFAREATEFGTRFFAPAALVTIAAGIFLVLDLDYGFGHFWILGALAVWVYTIVSNVTWLPKLGERIGVLVAEKGPEAAEVRDAGGQMFRWRALETGLLVFVIFLMTYKPFA